MHQIGKNKKPSLLVLQSIITLPSHLYGLENASNRGQFKNQLIYQNKYGKLIRMLT